MKKRGQMQLSFGMIFSILIIIVTVAVAFYVIKEFLVTSNCTELRAFQDNLQGEIDTVWRSAAAQMTYTRVLPSSVKSVCFGDPKSWDKAVHRIESETFSSYQNTPQNLFIYPVQCGRAVSVRDISHVSITKGFCVLVVKGEIKLTISKSSSTKAEVVVTP